MISSLNSMASPVFGSWLRGEPSVSSRRVVRRATLAPCALAIALAILSPCHAAAGDEARAPTTAPSPENRKAAGAAFAQGERAFATGKFAEAGEAFEDAYSFVPHPDALLNAARAWQKAGELARAANLFERYLKNAPDNAPDRKAAVSSLEQLVKKLGRLDIYAPSVDGLEVDDRPVLRAGATTRVFVTPGTHVVRGRVGAVTIQQSQAVEQGGVASVALAVDSAASEQGDPQSGGGAAGAGGADTAGGAGGAGPVATKPSEAPSRPLPPLAIAIGGGVTAALLGVTIASGVDTLNARSDFDAAPTEDLLASGRSKQMRTNILIGVTAGAAALTTVAAIWLVQWKKPKSAAKVGLGAGTIYASGSF